MESEKKSEMESDTKSEMNSEMKSKMKSKSRMKLKMKLRMRLGMFLDKHFLRRFFSTILLIAMFICFGYYYYKTTIEPTRHVPEINFAENIKQKVTVDYTDTDLLKGVTSYDVEDGDLTGNIIIEQKSNIYSGNKREIVYVVCDTNSNVTKAKREVTYVNYKPPVIESIDETPRIKNRKYSEVLSCFRATDVFDGDISDKIQIESIDTSGDNVSKGIFPVTLSVTNSCGDVTIYKKTVKLLKEEE